MTGIIKFGTIILVKDEEASQPQMEQYRAEVADLHIRVQIDRTMRPPYYEVFREWKEGSRLMNERIFATSTFSRLEDFFNIENPKLRQ